MKEKSEIFLHLTFHKYLIIFVEYKTLDFLLYKIVTYILQYVKQLNYIFSIFFLLSIFLYE